MSNIAFRYAKKKTRPYMSDNVFFQTFQGQKPQKWKIYDILVKK